MATALTPDLLKAFTLGVKSVFQDAFVASKGPWSELATVIPSTTNAENYSWLGEIPVMRQWLDERQIRDLKEYSQTITNYPYEATIGIDRSVIEDDQTGQVKIRVMSLAEAASAFYDKLYFDTLAANGNAYDGTAFFHANHSNLITTVFSGDALGDAIAAMENRKLPTETTEPMPITVTDLLVPTALRFSAASVLNSHYWPDSSGAGAHAANPYKGIVRLWWSSRLATSTEWYLFDCSHAVRPIIIQERVAPEFNALDNPDTSESAFMRDKYLYGARARAGAGYGLFQYAYKSTGAG
jgi:phage major head subunit gpT-like protein